MDDNGFSKEIIQAGAVIIESHPGVALIGKEGRKVTGVIRMFCISRIIVHAGAGKIAGAVTVFMNMKTMKSIGEPTGFLRKSHDLRFKQDPAVRSFITFQYSIEIGIAGEPADPCKSIRIGSFLQTGKR